MGLLYQFPNSKNETDYVEYQSSPASIIIKSYGLPYIFWFYAIGILATLFLLALTIWPSITTLYQYDDVSAKIIALATFALLILSPFALLLPFFFQKILKAKSKKLEIKATILGIKVYHKTFENVTADKLIVRHFLSSPNYARLHQNEHNQDFQNRGYFELTLELPGSLRPFVLDRSSRKQDLIDLQSLLSDSLS